MGTCPSSVAAFPQVSFVKKLQESSVLGIDLPQSENCQDDCLGFRFDTRVLVKVTLGCRFIHVLASFIYKIYFNHHLEDSSSNLNFYPWNIPRFRLIEQQEGKKE